jgi:hemoglobin
MKRFSLILFAATFIAAPALAKDSLYQRMGGYDGIAAVTDLFVGKIIQDPSLGRFLKGHSVSSGKQLRQHVIEFICEKSGGPCAYTGRSMLDVHTGLKITEDDWTTSRKLFGDAMAELKVDPELQKDVVGFVDTLKPDIVGH